MTMTLLWHYEKYETFQILAKNDEFFKKFAKNEDFFQNLKNPQFVQKIEKNENDDFFPQIFVQIDDFSNFGKKWWLFQIFLVSQCQCHSVTVSWHYELASFLPLFVDESSWLLAC